MKGYIYLERDFRIRITESTFINNQVLDLVEDREKFYLNLLSSNTPIKVEADFSTYFINPSKIYYIEEKLDNSPIED